MELSVLLNAIISLSFVLLCMYFLLKIVQKYSHVGNRIKGTPTKNNLKIENTIYIDETMKVVNISNNSGMQYIIAVGKSSSFLVDKYKNNDEEAND